MKYRVKHRLPGRIRLELIQNLSVKSIDFHFEEYLDKKSVHKLDYNPKTASLLIEYSSEFISEQEIIDRIDSLPLIFQTEESELDELRESKRDLIFRILKMIYVSPFEPKEIKPILSLYNNSAVIKEGLDNLSNKKINSSVLDALAILTAIFTGDYLTASITSLLLDIGKHLELWSKDRIKKDLKKIMAYQLDKVWIQKEGVDVQIPIQELKISDLIILRSGYFIPGDGIVQSGEAYVNQSAFTGESHPVLKEKDSEVYAGTVVTEGLIIVQLTHVGTSTKISKLIDWIANSDKLKTKLESRAEELSDNLVPFILGLGAMTFVLTQDIIRASSTILVDYSCAIKLSTPLTIITAMRVSSQNNILFKGGKYIEKLAEADVYVLDKTGTLTHAKPEVLKVISFGVYSEEFLLVNAACLEEHYHHPIANAIEEESKQRGLSHDIENHKEIQYILAHGISAIIDGKEVLLGSGHFLRDDCNILLDKSQKVINEYIFKGHSVLYMAVNGQLEGAIIISDKIRSGAFHLISDLKKSGIDRIIMLTGDNESVAKEIASNLGIAEFKAEIFPEDKLSYIKELKDKGHIVVMVGDGINDSMALSQADIGISFQTGTALAQEVADVVLINRDIDAIYESKQLAERAMQRVKDNYNFILTINTALLGVSLMGYSSPLFSALSHNLSTILIAMNSIRKL